MQRGGRLVINETSKRRDIIKKEKKEREMGRIVGNRQKAKMEETREGKYEKGEKGGGDKMKNNPKYIREKKEIEETCMK